MQYRLSESEIYAHRPKPFFFLNTRDAGEYTREKTEESLKALKECGFSGFVLFNKPPTGFDKESYLSDTWFAAVENFAVSARGNRRLVLCGNYGRRGNARKARRGV